MDNISTHFHELYTIGYEGRDIADFIERLKDFNITRVIDVRELPISRKRGFSKSALSEKLGEANIQYIHFKSLGSPSQIRNRLKQNKNYIQFFKAYSQYLSENTGVLDEVYRFISDGNNCLMCYEVNPNRCHRSIIAKMLKKRNGENVDIIHL